MPLSQLRHPRFVIRSCEEHKNQSLWWNNIYRHGTWSIALYLRLQWVACKDLWFHATLNTCTLYVYLVVKLYPFSCNAPFHNVIFPRMHNITTSENDGHLSWVARLTIIQPQPYCNALSNAVLYLTVVLCRVFARFAYKNPHVYAHVRIFPGNSVSRIPGNKTLIHWNHIHNIINPSRCKSERESPIVAKLCAISAPSNDMNQWRLFVDWNLRNKFRWNFHSNFHLKKNKFEHVVCEMAPILFRPWCVKAYLLMLSAALT